MGDQKNEDLEDVSGGPDTVAPIITDALEDVDGAGGGEGAYDTNNPFEGVDGGAVGPGGVPPLD